MKKRAMNGAFYSRVREILESARTHVARSVNSTQVIANWLVGREIVEEEQRGEKRADYGEQLLVTLSRQITRDFGRGYSPQSLSYIKQFYLAYPHLLLAGPILHAARGKLPIEGSAERQGEMLLDSIPPLMAILHALRGELPKEGTRSQKPTRGLSSAKKSNPTPTEILQALPAKSWQPGQLNLNLSWTHYRTLLRVDNSDARSFYEIEATDNNWSARELERQINSLLYERLALSKDKKGLLRLAKKGQEIQQPADVFKDPIVIEFLGLPESPKLVETELEQALLDNLQAFLLELGKGFAFVARQQRLSLDGDHFYIDLVFYHTILKCFVLIDLKNGKLTHQDLGQLQLYVNYYDEERRSDGDNPTLGLILCTDKNDTVVKYTLGPSHSKRIFARRYKLYLPTEAELRAEIEREKRLVISAEKKTQNPKTRTRGTQS
jgi:predicted nuclease of restriction endonuclease-like (RecB) superfamily